MLPTAFSGIITGVLLGLARVMGETAPLLILGAVHEVDPADLFSGNMADAADDDQPGPHRDRSGHRRRPRCWAAALTLILLVLLLNLARPRLIARFGSVKK